MIKHIVIACGLFCLSADLGATERNIPNNYYNSLDGQSGAALKNAACAIIYPHTKLSYSSLWRYYPETDAKPGTNEIWDIYDDEVKYFPGNGGAHVSMNKEHSFPKSWWGGAENKAFSDIFHLYPVLAKANSARSNHPYGEVDTSKGTDYNNGVSLVGYPVLGSSVVGDSKVFEPDDRYKGDLARTYFYMVTCYQDLTWDKTYMVNNNSYLTLNSWSQEMLIRWHRQDPVSQKEIDRNEAIYQIQGNRNPFIDFPDLAEYIWGSKAGQKFVLADHMNGTVTPPVDPQEPPTLISPARDFELHFGEVALGHVGSAQLKVKGQNLDETKSLRLAVYDDSKTDDAALFAIDGGYVANISATAANSADGILVTINYTPQSIGEHESRMVISGGGIKGSIGIGLIGECLPAPDPSAPVAMPATDITTTSYTANWIPADGEEVDYYIVNRTQYINGQATTEQIETEDTQLEITDFCGSESYTVQAVRLEVASPESNSIIVDTSSIVGIDCGNRFGVTQADGGVLITCSRTIARLQIVDMCGRNVATYTNVANNDVISLPAGIYMFSAAGTAAPIKVIVR